MDSRQDFEGTPLEVGDEVVRMEVSGNSSSYLFRATVVGFTPKYIKVLCSEEYSDGSGYERVERTIPARVVKMGCYSCDYLDRGQE